MATIGDVAKKAGVSTTLVSRYLNGVKGVSPASKEKIENAIRELHYIPDESARMLVRRRGGASAASPAAAAAAPPVKEAIFPAVAMLCEDIDFSLISSFYLGAKHALWAEEEHRVYRILLFMIDADETRGKDEDDTLAFIAQVCRGVCAIAPSEALKEKLNRISENLTVLTLTPAADAKTLYRSVPDFQEICKRFEEESGEMMLRLCSAITENETGVTIEALKTPYSLVISDESYQEHSPLGRSLQSHLL